MRVDLTEARVQVSIAKTFLNSIIETCLYCIFGDGLRFECF